MRVADLRPGRPNLLARKMGSLGFFEKTGTSLFYSVLRTQNATITRQKYTKFSTGNMKKPLARIMLRRITLKRIFREKGGKMWIVFIWFGVWTSGGSCVAIMNH